MYKIYNNCGLQKNKKKCLTILASCTAYHQLQYDRTYSITFSYAFLERLLFLRELMEPACIPDRNENLTEVWSVNSCTAIVLGRVVYNILVGKRNRVQMLLYVTRISIFPAVFSHRREKNYGTGKN